MQIGELARTAGCSVDAVRMYERLGLLRSERRANGYRDYPDVALELLQYILKAKALGFTLAEIADARSNVEAAPAEVLSGLFLAKAALIDQRIAELTTLRDALVARAATDCPLVDGASVRAGA